MSVQDDKTTVSDGILLSDAAAEKVRTLLEQEGRDDLALRVAVQPGGCSGLRYQLFFDERSLDGDVVKDFDGVKVVTDRMSAPYLAAPPSTSSTPSRSRASRSTTRTPPAPAPAATRSAKPVPVRHEGARPGRIRPGRAPSPSRPARQPRGSGLPVVASTTVRSPSGCCSCAVTDCSSAIMMHAWPGLFGVSVIFTMTDAASSRTVSA